MNDPHLQRIERVMRDARRSSSTPVVSASVARTVLRRARRRQRLQAASIGGASAMVVVAGGAVAFNHHGSDGLTASAGSPSGLAPVTEAASAPASPAPAASLNPINPSPGSASVLTFGPLTATPECSAVERHLDTMSEPDGYVLTRDAARPPTWLHGVGTPPIATQWERAWLHTGGVPTSVMVTASCQQAAPPSFAAGADSSGTVTPVTVQGHSGWLVTDLEGSYAAVTWSPNATTEVTVAANAIHPASFGNVSIARQQQLRLSDADLLALAQTVPTS